MPLIPIAIPPGVVKTDSPHSVMGRWIDCDKVRFFHGFPQKIGGFQRVSSATFDGLARGCKAWTTYAGYQYLAFGTQNDFYLYSEDVVNRITPYRSAGNALTDPFTTTSGSPLVSVADVAHGVDDVGVTVTFSGAGAVGGLTIDGDYTVTSITDADNYVITASSNASSSAGPGGGSVTVSYELNYGLASLSYLSGWGVGEWGYGGWGEDQIAAAAVTVEPRWWTMANYGEDLVVCPLDGTLYMFDSSGSISRPPAISNAPSRVRATFVTSERFIFALGCTNLSGNFDPMVVRWPSVEDSTDWTPSETNTSNERKLQGGTRLMGGAPLGGGLAAVWSDFGLFVFQYTGSDLIYDSRMIGNDCGLVGPNAFVVVDGTAFWMSIHGFHYYSGSINDVPNQNDISDWIFDNIDEAQVTKTFCLYQKDFNEVWWFFPSLDGDGEPDLYVMINLDTFAWATGTMDRTAACRYPSGETRPIFFGTDGYIYAHDDRSDPNDNGAAMEAYIEMAPFTLGQGDQTVDVFSFIPDFERQTEDVSVYFYGKEQPRDAVYMEDTITVSDTSTQVDTRVSGRLLGMKLTSNAQGGSFRLGKMKIDVSAAGAKTGERQA